MVEGTLGQTTGDAAFQIEHRGIDITPEGARHGRPSELFRVWFAANIVILGVVIGGVITSLGLTIPEALAADVIGCASFFVVGLAAIPGARAGTSTLALTRSAFGIRGNIAPAFLSWATLVGWETVSLVVSTYAIAELLLNFGIASSVPVLVICLIIAAILTFSITLLGHETIVLVQTWASWIFGALTVVVVVVLLSNYKAPTAAPTPVTGNVVTTFLLAMSIMFASTIFAWINYAADYTRYLPKGTSGRAIVFWNGLGGFIPGSILIGTGVLIGAVVNIASAANPIQALGTLIPGWLLVPYLVTAVAGVLTGNFLNSYSSGLSLQAMGVTIPRPRTILIDATISILLGLYAVLVFNFVSAFTSFLSLEVVWIASWAGVYLIDARERLRGRGYDGAALFAKNSGPYWYRNGINWAGIISWLLGCLAAFLFTNSSLWASPLTTGPLGGADLSVFMGFGVGAIVYWLFLRAGRTAQAPYLSATGSST